MVDRERIALAYIKNSLYDLRVAFNMVLLSLATLEDHDTIRRYTGNAIDISREKINELIEQGLGVDCDDYNR